MLQTPGWVMEGTTGKIEVRLFVDLLCSDSKNAHEVWKELLEKDSPKEGKKYKDLITLRITPFPLPYKVHSYSLA